MNDQTVLRAWAITRRDVIAGSVWLGVASEAHGWEAALPVTGLDHVNIRTPDVRRAAEFYAKLFGTQVSRAENAFASAGSRRGELWFVRLGQSSLAISPAAPGEKPGIDHFCFGVEGFNRDAMKQKIAGFNLQIDRTDPPGNNLWTRDPDGHLIQFSAPQNPRDPRGPVSAEFWSRRQVAVSRNPHFSRYESRNSHSRRRSSNSRSATTGRSLVRRPRGHKRGDSELDCRNWCWDQAPAESISALEWPVLIRPPL
jgi:glyoxylase I family protein